MINVEIRRPGDTIQDWYCTYCAKAGRGKLNNEALRSFYVSYDLITEGHKERSPDCKAMPERGTQYRVIT